MPVHTDTNIQIGIMLGCEWTPTEIAQHLGVTVGAISQRKKRKESRQTIEKFAGFTRLAVAKHVQKRIHEAENSIEEKKKVIREKSYKVIEKTLQDGETAEEVTPVHLKAAEMGLDRTEGKPIDRKAVMEMKLTGELAARDVDGDDLASVLAEAARLNELRRKALPEYKDAELVE